MIFIRIIEKIRLLMERLVSIPSFSDLYETYRDFTMIARDIFIGNLALVHKFSSVRGCIVECGVWRGGMIGAIASLLGDERQYYLFDSFEGLPKAKYIDGATAIKWQKDTNSPLYFDNCKAEISYAQKAMEMSGVTQYTIKQGWFSKTLKKNSFPQPIAILRLDADWYESTMECLTALYDYVASGGIIIVDDYYAWDGCAKAVHKFLSKKNDASRIYRSNDGVCYIVKS
jgi:O-methyltransferase